MFEWLRNLFPKKQKLGLLPLPPDERDFDLGALGWGEYTPKNTSVVIESSFPVRNQLFNTCTFNSRVVAKERDEGVMLSVPFLVKIAKEWGLITRDGFANLRASELVVQKVGVCTDDLLSESDNLPWDEYSKNNVSELQKDNALEHRSSTFWAVRNRYELWKALDEGHTVRMGSVWSNNTGKLAPYILDFSTGAVVGGHAYLVIGYDRNYNGQDVFVVQNSFGPNWGNKGRMYIKVKDFEYWAAKYGAFTDLDMPKDMAKMFNQYNGKLLKETGSVDVYVVKSGKKWLFPDEATLYSHGHLDEQIVDDVSNFLKEVPLGGTLNFWEGKNVETIKALILRAPHIKTLFSKYFSELFVN